MTKLKYYAVFVADTEEDYNGLKNYSYSKDIKNNGYTVFFPDFDVVTGGWSYNEALYMAHDLLAGIYYNNLEDDFGQIYDNNIKLNTPLSKDEVLNLYLVDSGKSNLNKNDFVKLIEVDVNSKYFSLENMNKRADKIDKLYKQRVNKEELEELYKIIVKDLN